jgi:hypothetical protein
MFNEDVKDLYPRVPVGTHVLVTWNRFNTSAVADVSEPAPAAADDDAPKKKPVPAHYKRHATAE